MLNQNPSTILLVHSISKITLVTRQQIFIHLFTCLEMQLHVAHWMLEEALRFAQYFAHFASRDVPFRVYF